MAIWHFNVSEHFDVNELPATVTACGGGEIKDTRAFTSCKVFSCAEQKLRENASAPAGAQHLWATIRATESKAARHAPAALCRPPVALRRGRRHGLYAPPK